MSVQVEKLEKNMAKLTVELEADVFEKALQTAYLKRRKDITIPGFRKGKAPRVLIEKMYGPEVFYEDAADEVLQSEYPKVVDESELKVMTRPDVSIEEIGKGKPFKFTATVAIYPEVKLGQYKDIEVPILDTDVTDEEIDKEIKNEQEKNSRMVSIEDRPAANGDIVTLDYTGVCDGKEFEGGSAKDYPLTLGEGTFIPGFEEQLVGANVGDKVDVNVTFPEDYHAEDLKGKEAVFHCEIHKIEYKELPELDDEFAQDVSEFDTFEEYKADVKKTLTTRKEKANKEADKNAAVAKVVANAEMDLPDVLIADMARRLLENYARRLQSQGLSIDQYAQMMGMNGEQLLESMKPQALEQLKMQFTLEKVAEVEKLEVSDEYIDTKLEEMAQMYRMSLEEVKKLFGEQQLEAMKEELIPEIAANFIAEHTTETEAATKEAEKEKKKREKEAEKATKKTTKKTATNAKKTTKKTVKEEALDIANEMIEEDKK